MILENLVTVSFIVTVFKFFQLPLDLSALSEEERKARLEKRKPKRKVKITEIVEDNYNAKKYLKYLKK